MRTITTISRYLVGILFIVSGLVKANDPLGLSYKMQEFFEIWNTDLAASGFFAKGPLISLFSYLHEHSLFLSVVMITLEIVAGVALVIGWQRTFVLRLLLLLIVFFTFLTAYAYGSGKFKNCGCFGDCLPITPFTSFIKDLLLLGLIVLLWFGRRHIKPLVRPASGGLAVLTTLLLTVGFQWYVLNYLPVVDCLPYKKGNNIAQQMQIPAGALPDSFAIRFVYEKGGKKYEFGADNLPADLDAYTYVDRVDKLIRKGNAEPPIKGFALMGISGADSTQAILSLPKAFVLFAEKFAGNNQQWVSDFKSLATQAQQKGIPVFVATASSMGVAAQFLQSIGLANLPLLAVDFTAVRSAARANPTLYYLENGTILEKYSYRQLDHALQLN